jgi:hypothetical protein
VTVQNREPCRALREDLEVVPLGTPHDVENTPDVLDGNVLVEEIAH